MRKRDTNTSSTHNVLRLEEDDTTVQHIRFSGLKSVAEKALDESIKTLGFEKLRQCYPELSKYKSGKQAIDIARAQIINFWKNTTVREFQQIFKEYDLENKLNQLDDLIEEAKQRKRKARQRGNKIGGDINSRPLYIDKLKPNEIILSKLLEPKQKYLEELNSDLSSLKVKNDELFSELNMLVKESKDCLEDIEFEISKVEKFFSSIDKETIPSEEKVDELLDYVVDECNIRA